ncbi:MAG: hypothetical protein GF364_11330 [Candidatus Lokiarchaeota archaeon]|nr:hypothetical protein [Candidatus Lokiarchaeota archaeon]
MPNFNLYLDFIIVAILIFILVYILTSRIRNRWAKVESKSIERIPIEISKTIKTKYKITKYINAKRVNLDNTPLVIVICNRNKDKKTLDQYCVGLLLAGFTPFLVEKISQKKAIVDELDSIISSIENIFIKPKDDRKTNKNLNNELLNIYIINYRKIVEAQVKLYKKFCKESIYKWIFLSPAFQNNINNIHSLEIANAESIFILSTLNSHINEQIRIFKNIPSENSLKIPIKNPDFKKHETIVLSSIINWILHTIDNR